MKNYAKVGNRNGRPGYRTASTFRNKKVIKLAGIKAATNIGEAKWFGKKKYENGKNP